MKHRKVQIILGTSQIGEKAKDPLVKFETPEEIASLLDVFHSRGYRSLDTARGYSPLNPCSTEPRLGAVSAGNRFNIDTKVLSQGPGCHQQQRITEEITASLEALKVSQVDIEYLHSPDRTTPFEETCEAIDKAYKEGKFKRFGLSNFRVDEVEQILEICEKRGFVKPSVYQGQYNPVVRSSEKDLFQLLRKHDIAFYAWSPAAGGFFAGSYKRDPVGTRFDTSHYIGIMYEHMYRRNKLIAAVEDLHKVAAANGITSHAAALRWTIFHSQLKAEHGDAVIIGASNNQQLASNLDSIEKGPLSQVVSEALDSLYELSEGRDIPYHA